MVCWSLKQWTKSRVQEISPVHYVFPSNVLGMCMWLSIPVNYFNSWQLLPSKIKMYLFVKFGNIEQSQYTLFLAFFLGGGHALCSLQNASYLGTLSVTLFRRPIKSLFFISSEHFTCLKSSPSLCCRLLLPCVAVFSAHPITTSPLYWQLHTVLDYRTHMQRLGSTYCLPTTQVRAII
jgi:hypothetical protein